MKIRLPVLILYHLLFGACREDPEDIGPCGFKNLMKDLPWLKEKIGRLSKSGLGTCAYFQSSTKEKESFGYMLLYLPPLSQPFEHVMENADT